MKKWIFFAVWFLGLSVPLSYMMGMHSLSLVASQSNDIKNLNPHLNSKWSKLHFLGSDCDCSKNVYNSLVARSPQTEFNETIFILGKNPEWEKTLKEKKYNVFSVSTDEFEKKYSITAVPQLIILDEKNETHYSGGYTKTRGPASVVEDIAIARDLKAKNKTEDRPIFGCLNGSINRKNADPFKIKY